MFAAHPRQFGRRRVPPSLPCSMEPESPARVRTRSQVAVQQERPDQATTAARPMAEAAGYWARTFARGGTSFLVTAIAKLAAISTATLAWVSAMVRAAASRRRQPTPVNPLLDTMARSGRGLFVRFLAYVSGIALLSFLAAQLFESAPVVAAVEPAPRPEWITVTKPYPAFHLDWPDAAGEQHYAIRRHSEGGGRKDIMSWGEPDTSPRYSLVEIYRPGGEIDGFSSALTEIQSLANDLAAGSRMRESLPIESKFGPVATVDFNIGLAGAGHCVGFVRAFDEPRLRIAGLSCNRDSLVDRSAIACAIDRLTLMSAGSAPDIARLFAQAELKRNFCGQRDPILYATPRRSIDPAKPLAATLRGRLMR